MPSLKNLVLLIAATVASGSHALPTVELVNRQQHLVGWFAMCPGPLWGPGCEVSSWSSKQCYPLPAALNGAVQSASPFKNGLKGACFLYHEDGCMGERTPRITYPGFDNFETAGIYGLYKSWGCDCGDVCESW